MPKGHKPSDGTSKTNNKNDQVIRLLNTIGQRLIQSEQERDAVKSAVKTLNNRLDDLDGKADTSERAFLTIQSKMNQVEQRDLELKTLLDKQKTYLDKIEKAASLVDHIEETLAQQKKITRRLDQVAQDRSRMDRKLDRIEESVMQAQDMINAKALVLLTDKDVAASESVDKIPVKADGGSEKPANDDIPWWKPASTGQAITVACVFSLAIVTGWALNEKPFEALQSATSQIVYNSSGSQQNINATDSLIANSIGDDLSTSSQQEYESDVAYHASSDIQEQPANITSANVPIASSAAAPEEIASSLNQIEPAIGDATDVSASSQKDETVTKETLDNYVQIALPEDSQRLTKPDNPFNLQAFLNANKPNKRLEEDIQRDPKLPQSLRVIENNALEGDHKAQHDLGVIYAAGHADVSVNYDKALLYFKHAAHGQIPNAAYNLGVLHHQGLGTDQNIETALGWYYAAADLGHPDAMYNLGIAHIEGIGTSYNPHKAEEYFQNAAKAGVMEASYNLGLIHENGLLGQTNQDEAIFWYKLASDKNSTEAITALEQLSSRLGLSNQDIERIFNEKSALFLGQKTNNSGDIPHKKKEVKPRVTQAKSNANAAPAAIKASAKADRILSPEQKTLDITRRIQEQLIDRGLYPGPATGFRDPQTEDAIYSYQAIHELARTGEPTEALLVHMRTGIEEFGSR